MGVVNGGRQWRRLFVAAVALMVVSPALRAQALGVGKLLVASREVGDPNFSRTVVLLVRYGRTGVVGLILNRPSQTPLSVALKGMEEARGRSDPIYLGGPVGLGGALALLRTQEPPPEAPRVLDGVHLLSSREELARGLASRAGPASLRVYLGYAGWTHPRLQAEVSRRIWHVLDGSSGIVFDAYPASLWERLIPKAEPKLARLQ
ncbi:MAG: YqgE/AlgH family protein [Bryobacterales bacterium]|nr:YqgE/AlgH family protein [Bryobacterales bacterium]